MAEQKNKTRFPFFRSLAFPLRIFLLILVVSVFIIAATAQYFTASFEDYLAAHVRDMAMNQPKSSPLTRVSLRRLNIVITSVWRRLPTNCRAELTSTMWLSGIPTPFVYIIRTRKNWLPDAVHQTRCAGKRGELLYYR